MSDGEFVFSTPIPATQLLSSWRRSQLIRLEFCSGSSVANSVYSGAVSSLSQALSDYFSGGTQQLYFPVSLHGLSLFQSRVLTHLATIHRGYTQTYGDIASVLGSSPRAVGRACATNPFPILIPCHRVVAKDGVGGFIGQGAGDGVDIKRWLLAHEGVRCG